MKLIKMYYKMVLITLALMTYKDKLKKKIFINIELKSSNGKITKSLHPIAVKKIKYIKNTFSV